jgi:hypothetical protein
MGSRQDFIPRNMIFVEVVTDIPTWQDGILKEWALIGEITRGFFDLRYVH